MVSYSVTMLLALTSFQGRHFVVLTSILHIPRTASFQITISSNPPYEISHSSSRWDTTPRRHSWWSLLVEEKSNPNHSQSVMFRPRKQHGSAISHSAPMGRSIPGLVFDLTVFRHIWQCLFSMVASCWTWQSTTPLTLRSLGVSKPLSTYLTHSSYRLSLDLTDQDGFPINVCALVIPQTSE